MTYQFLRDSELEQISNDPPQMYLNPPLIVINNHGSAYRLTRGITGHGIWIPIATTTKMEGFIIFNSIPFHTVVVYREEPLPKQLSIFDKF